MILDQIESKQCHFDVHRFGAPVMHKMDAHWSNDCRVLKEQAERMHEAWKSQSPAERSRKKRERFNSKNNNRKMNCMKW